MTFDNVGAYIYAGEMLKVVGTATVTSIVVLSVAIGGLLALDAIYAWCGRGR